MIIYFDQQMGGAYHIGSVYFEVLMSWLHGRVAAYKISVNFDCGRVAVWPQPLKNPNP